MPQQRVNPTRMELLRLKKRTALAQKGHKLLKEKRDGLMQEFLSLVKEVRSLRTEVDKRLGGALRHFGFAEALMTPQMAKLLARLELKRVEATATEKNVMGVRIPEFVVEQKESGEKYSWWETPGELDVALALFEQVLPLLVDLAAKEKAANLLAQEIERTRRRVNALEHVLIPQLQETSRYIRMKLEEQGRAAIITTMKVKEEIA